MDGQVLLGAIFAACLYFMGLQVVHGVKWLGHEVGSAVHHVVHRAVHHPLGLPAKDEKK
jgi:hypothetical protein